MRSQLQSFPFPVEVSAIELTISFLVLLIVMIAPDSPVRQKEGDQAEEEEEARDRREGDQRGTPTPGAYTPTGQSRSGVSDAWNKRKQKHGRWCGVLLYMNGRGGYGLVLSSHDWNGGSYFVRPRKVCFFWSNLRGSRLKDAVSR